MLNTWSTETPSLQTFSEPYCRALSEPGGTRWRTGGEMKRKLANGVSSQYSHATSERGISSIIKADAHTSAASSRMNWRPHRFEWTRSFSGKDEIWFLRVYHHVPHELYQEKYSCILWHSSGDSAGRRSHQTASNASNPVFFVETLPCFPSKKWIKRQNIGIWNNCGGTKDLFRLEKKARQMCGSDPFR